MAEEGLADLGSWLIVLEDIPYDTAWIHKLWSSGGDKSDYNEAYHAFLTIHHETVHFWHAISTAFLYRYSCDYINLCTDAIKIISQEKIQHDDHRFRDLQNEFRKLEDCLITPSESNPPIRPIDVMEGCAVLCSYRMNLHHLSHEAFWNHLHHNDYSDLKYKIAYEFATDLLGELAFDFFAPACYLALQCKDPGGNLAILLDHAKEAIQIVPRKYLLGNPLGYLLMGMSMEEKDCFPLRIRRRIPQGGSAHPVLHPYLKTIATTPYRHRVNDIFARPYLYIHKHFPEEEAEDFREFISDMLPPLFVPARFPSSRREYRPLGLGGRLGEKYLSTVFNLHGFVGLAERLVLGKCKPMFCPHHACPVHKTGLCQGYFAFPLKKFEECGFREALKTREYEWLLACGADSAIRRNLNSTEETIHGGHQVPLGEDIINSLAQGVKLSQEEQEERVKNTGNLYNEFRDIFARSQELLLWQKLPSLKGDLWQRYEFLLDGGKWRVENIRSIDDERNSWIISRITINNNEEIVKEVDFRIIRHKMQLAFYEEKTYDIDSGGKTLREHSVPSDFPSTLKRAEELISQFPQP